MTPTPNARWLGLIRWTLQKGDLLYRRVVDAALPGRLAWPDRKRMPTIRREPPKTPAHYRPLAPPSRFRAGFRRTLHEGTLCNRPDGGCSLLHRGAHGNGWATARKARARPIRPRSRQFVTSRLVDVVGLGASSVDYVNLLPQAAGSPGTYAKLQISSHFISCGGQVATMLATCRALGPRRPLPGADRQRRERPAHPRGARAAPRGCLVGDRPRRRQPVRRSSSSTKRPASGRCSGIATAGLRSTSGSSTRPCSRRACFTWTTWTRRPRSGQRAWPPGAACS